MGVHPVRAARKDKINYARLNEVGMEAAVLGDQEDQLEEGQIIDSPFEVEVDDHEFRADSVDTHSSIRDPEFSDMSSVPVEASFVPDYNDVVNTVATGGEIEDLDQDEVWSRQECIMAEN